MEELEVIFEDKEEFLKIFTFEKDNVVKNNMPLLFSLMLTEEKIFTN